MDMKMGSHGKGWNNGSKKRGGLDWRGRKIFKRFFYLPSVFFGSVLRN